MRSDERKTQDPNKFIGQPNIGVAFGFFEALSSNNNYNVHTRQKEFHPIS